MELIRKNIHMNKSTGKSSLQLNLNDDVNVPDTKPDIASIMKLTGEVHLEEQKILTNKLYVKGAFLFQLLYLSAEGDHQIHTMAGKLPIEDSIHLEQECSMENALIQCELEDLTANVINSRKVSIKTLIQLKVTAEEVYDESACIAVNSDYEVCTRTGSIQVSGLAVCKKDSYRFRDEIILPSSKNSIHELLYRSLSLKNLDFRLLKDQFSIKGDLMVFLLYTPEEGDAAAEYYETELPFHAVIDCLGCDETMTPDISLAITDKTLELRQDADGESRVVSLDVLMELHIKIYEENSIDIIQDLYSPVCTLTPIFRPVTYENLLLRNTSRTRISDHVKIKDSAPKILQICHGSGTVHLDELYPVEEGLMAEGIIDADIFYITPEDSRPMFAVKALVPFQQLIEVRDLTGDAVFSVTPELEQLTVLSSEADELEIKASLLLTSLVFERKTANFLSEVEEMPPDEALMLSLPGMTGYIVQENDDLWSIAKLHHTTIDSILELNELSSEQLPAGTRLLLLKEITA